MTEVCQRKKTVLGREYYASMTCWFHDLSVHLLLVNVFHVKWRLKLKAELHIKHSQQGYFIGHAVLYWQAYSMGFPTVSDKKCDYLVK